MSVYRGPTNRKSYTEAMNSQTISSDPNYDRAHAARVQLPPTYSEWLLPGEEVQFEDPTLFLVYYKDEKVHGRAYVTNYRLRFEPDTSSPENATNGKVVNVPLGSISKIEKAGHSNVNATDELYGLLILCKDTRNLFFEHDRETHSRRRLYEYLQRFAFPNTNQLPFFATLYCICQASLCHPVRDGWGLYNAEQEFKRQGIRRQRWSITKINKEYKFSPTYPSVLAVPSEAVDRKDDGESLLQAVGKFRSKQRIPVLSWVDHRTGAAIVRSAQPLIGVIGKKSSKDEEYLKMVINTNQNSRRLIILDARPTANALANQLKGGGYEDYDRCELSFLDIEGQVSLVTNSLRNHNEGIYNLSMKGLKDACYPVIKMKSFNRRLARSKWLDHIRSILEGSVKAVSEVSIRKSSVLVHCSDGWDRTAQITSLSMIQLDPYYRTLEGFAVLIEKEWCSFGHKFSQRFGHGEDKHGDSERSPIFVQFIDCVWQLFNQFTSKFEFNVLYLKTILNELYGCRFGTFLYNSEKERHDMEVKKKTVSLWTHILENREQYMNKDYDPPSVSDEPLEHHLDTIGHKLHIRFWSDYYCQYNGTVIPDNKEIGSSRAPSTTGLPSPSTNGSFPSTSRSQEESSDEERQRSVSETIRSRRKDFFMTELRQRQVEMTRPTFGDGMNKRERHPSATLVTRV